MLRLDKLCLAYGAKDLFVDLDWRLDAGDRVGLIGANGSGKSSLLKVMVGKLLADAGQVLPSKGVRLGYLPQEGLLHSGRALHDEAMAAESIAPPAAEVEAAWNTHLGKSLAAATLRRPEAGYVQKGGKRGVHSEHLDYILADIQFLQRAYDSASW